MALEVMSINLQLSALFPLLLELPPCGGHPDAMSLFQDLGTVLTGQGQLQGSPAIPGLHIEKEKAQRASPTCELYKTA